MTINGDKQQPIDDNSKSKSIRILYMEDEVGLARLFQRRLEAVGYQVDIARDGQEGLEMYDADVYDVIVVDYKMPFYNGLEVLGILAQEGPVPGKTSIVPRSLIFSRNGSSDDECLGRRSSIAPGKACCRGKSTRRRPFPDLYWLLFSSAGAQAAIR